MGTTEFGIERERRLDQAAELDQEAYCLWLEEQLTGTEGTVDCDGSELSLEAVGGCAGSPVFMPPCLARDVEQCVLAGGMDLCADERFVGDDCAPLRACLELVPPNNACDSGQVTCLCMDGIRACADTYGALECPMGCGGP